MGRLDDGGYDIITDPNLVHPGFASYGDHTTGNELMMVVNGSTSPGDVVWEQTVSTDPNTIYVFAAYLSSAHPDSPTQLQFSVNSTVIGRLNASSTTGAWDLSLATWNSGTETSATIRILNNNTAAYGNDFALDDIFFGEVVFSTTRGTGTINNDDKAPLSINVSNARDIHVHNYVGQDGPTNSTFADGDRQ